LRVGLSIAGSHPPSFLHSMKRFPSLITLALFCAPLLGALTPAIAETSRAATQANASTKTPKKQAVARQGKPPSKTKPKSVRSKSAMPAKAAGTEAEFTNFTQWRAVIEFIDEMNEQHGFDRDSLREQFRKVQYRDEVVRLINPPPAGKAKNWTAYRDRFVEPKRVGAGAIFWNQHEAVLNRAAVEFGVPAEIIVGILGVETIFGKSTGKFSVMDALTTLAFAYPNTANRETRMTYFRGELKQVLLYARETNIDPFDLKGSFAGAIGWPQFMPGSIRRFAVDFDGDGRIDLRQSPVDAIGSIASFLAQHGWTAGQPLAFPATVTTDAAWPAMLGQGLQAKYSLEELTRAGVSVADGVPASVNFGLIDLQDGERPVQYWIGTNNFFAITQYNRSYYYAMAVIELGQAISRHRGR
jgi:membrane-bound lytic murein transglycosylase B